MHSVFAIEPEAINNWHDFRYLIEKFGYSKGALIACYPGRWPKLVLDACKKSGMGDIEFARVVERLRQAKEDRLCKLGLAYDPDVGWSDNAVAHAASGELDAVLVRQVGSPNGKVHAVEDVDDRLFAGCRDVTVTRDAPSLALAAAALVRGSRSIVIIDPYFRSKKPSMRVLQQLLDIVKSLGRQDCQMVIHAAYSKHSVSVGQYISEAQRWLQQRPCREISIRVVRWLDESLDFDLHARYLLSEHGGLRYDRGFKEPEDHEQRAMTTDVVCMDRPRRDEIANQFSDFEGNKNVHDVIELL